MRKGTPRTLGLPLLAALAAVVAVGQASGVTDLKRGDPAPPIAVTAIDGSRVETARMREDVLLLLFGEAGQERTHVACRQIIAVLDSPRLADQPIRWILILSKSSQIDDLLREMTDVRRPPIIVHDVGRAAFGAYQAVVQPTFVIVDRQGHVVHAMAGLTDRFGDVLFDGLSVALGKLSVERFEQTLHPSGDVSLDERQLRAERLTHFAHRLSLRGLSDLAEAKYRESLRLAPDSVPARLGLGNLLLEQGQADEAEALFREVLGSRPLLPEASLGLASVHVLRGGSELDDAEVLVCEVLERDPSRARAHFLMGLIHELRSEKEKAAASFKTAAELLLKRLEPGEIGEGP
jgi:Tfp pilus assembly protein PilF